ncbi:hypothetical protein HO173_012649 [Letharia columbiana]|uniref:Uncharacterized protein n=1 Tax=Letharia columbiana TaxID=112416 RepID=A0A8H6CLZ8_9LECA|nr:uncharacterized protein HO173_012649 [Letharia columbiana]KAF6225958.1 hypothetical protein HO173_012649 [Letharia columbiana]
MAKAVYVSYIAVVVHLLLLLRIVTANQPVPFPRGASGPNPRIPASSDTGETSVKLSTTYVEAVVKTATPPEGPSDASTDITPPSQP